MNTLQIKNGNSVLGIDLSRGRIVSFTGNGRDLCDGNAYPLFVVGMIAENCEKSRISSFDCALKSVEDKGGEYILTYAYLEKLIITATVAVDEETNDFRFRIQVKNSTKDLIEFVEYPGVSIEDDLDGSGNSKMLWLFNEGSLVSYNKDKMWPYEEPEYPCWGTLGVFPNMVQSQFMAYLYGEGGLYIGCHDQNCGVKQLDFYHKDGRIKLQLRFYSGAYYGDDFSMDFDVVFRFFKGEWQDACDIYRTWYEGVADAIKIEKNPDLPYIMITRPNFWTCRRDWDVILRRRDIVMQSYLKARQNGDKNVWFIDGLSFFTAPAQYGMTMDAIHPNDAGFQRMADSIGTFIRHILELGE